MTDAAPAATDVRYEQVDLHIGGVALEVAAVGRAGALAPVVFLHGFGSTKEDYLDIACQHAFAGRPFLAYDAPGCGMASSTTSFTGPAVPAPPRVPCSR